MSLPVYPTGTDRRPTETFPVVQRGGIRFFRRYVRLWARTFGDIGLRGYYLRDVVRALGEPLALGPTGTVPRGCYFVTTEHKDGFDSRYAAIGWICAPRILGVGRPIL